MHVKYQNKINNPKITYNFKVKLNSSQRRYYFQSHLVKFHDINKGVVITGKNCHYILLVATDNCKMCSVLQNNIIPLN